MVGQVAIFRDTIKMTLNSQDVNSLVDSVTTQANTFMNTLASSNILNVQTVMTPATKYGLFTHFQIVVTYAM